MKRPYLSILHSAKARWNTLGSDYPYSDNYYSWQIAWQRENVESFAFEVKISRFYAIGLRLTFLNFLDMSAGPGLVGSPAVRPILSSVK